MYQYKWSNKFNAYVINEDTDAETVVLFCVSNESDAEDAIEILNILKAEIKEANKAFLSQSKNMHSLQSEVATLEQANKRISELEALNAILSVNVDKQTRLVEALQAENAELKRLLHEKTMLLDVSDEPTAPDAHAPRVTVTQPDVWNVMVSTKVLHSGLSYGSAYDKAVEIANSQPGKIVYVSDGTIFYNIAPGLSDTPEATEA